MGMGEIRNKNVNVDRHFCFCDFVFSMFLFLCFYGDGFEKIGYNSGTIYYKTV